MESWIVLTILLMMIVTYVPRTAPLLFLTRFDLPKGVILWLKYIPVAVLSALLYPSILLPAGELDVSSSNEFLVAALPTMLVVWCTRSLFWTVVVGVLAVSMLREMGV